jgi:hypothetical protein
MRRNTCYDTQDVKSLGSKKMYLIKEILNKGGIGIFSSKFVILCHRVEWPAAIAPEQIHSRLE